MHAVIEVEGDVATIIDLGSASGTFVNDERTNKKSLALGDRIRIGPATITLGARACEGVASSLARARAHPRRPVVRAYECLRRRRDRPARRRCSPPRVERRHGARRAPLRGVPTRRDPRARARARVAQLQDDRRRRSDERATLLALHHPPRLRAVSALPRHRPRRRHEGKLQMLRVRRRCLHPVQRLRGHDARRRVRRSLRERPFRARAPRLRPGRPRVNPLVHRGSHLARGAMVGERVRPRSPA